MSVDTTSVFLTGSIVSVGLALFSWALALSHRGSPWFLRWALGISAVALGIGLYLTQGNVSPWLSILLANGLLLLGMGLIVRGLEWFAGALTPWVPVVVVYSGFMGLWYLGTFPFENYHFRASLLAAAFLVIGVRAAWLLVRHLPEERAQVPWLLAILGAVFGALAGALILNAVLVILGGAHNLQAGGPSVVLAYWAMLVTLLVWTFGLFSLVLFRDQRTMQRALETRDRMMALIAHDLRGPVGSIPVMLDMVRYPNLDEKDRLELLQAVTDTANQSVHLMETLLDWALAKNVKAQLHPEVLEVASLLGSAIAPLSATAQNKGIGLKLETVSPGLEVRADRRTVTTVLRNLVSNALKFTPSGGQVTVGAAVDGHTVVLFVADTGPGLPEGLVIKLNKGYAITSSRGTSGEKGTGLGLSLCREFAEANNGSLTFTSSPQGTRAMVCVPRAP